MDSAEVTVDEIARRAGEQMGARIEGLETKVNRLWKKSEEILEKDAPSRSDELHFRRIAALEAKIALLATGEDVRALRQTVYALQRRIDQLPVVSLDEAKQIYEADKPSEFTCENCNFGLEGNEDTCPSCKMPLMQTSENEQADLLRKARANSGLRCKACRTPVILEDPKCPKCGHNQAEPIKQAR